MSATNTVNFDSVTGKLDQGVNKGAQDIASALNNLKQNPDDPVNMFQAQRALAVFNLSITMESAVIKSLEDSMKSIIQRI